jgi:hypothetical protein
MIHVKLVIITLLGTLLLTTNRSFAQRGNGGHHGNGHQHGNGRQHMNNRVIVRSHYRPKTIVVYHPIWAPRHNYNRRWVYFPRQNFYWDNWRQMYVYRSGAVWIFNATPPPAAININIENEKHYELKEVEDDTDDVYKTNDNHQTEYKPE